MITINRPSKRISDILVEIPEIPAKDWKIAQNNSVEQSLIPVTTWLGILYIIFSICELLFLKPAIRISMATVSGSTALFLFGLLFLLHNYDLHLEMAHPVGAVLVGLTLLNGLALIFLTGDISHSFYLILTFFGISLFIVDNLCFFLLIIFTLLCWGLSIFVVTPYLGFSIKSIFFLFTSIGLAIVFHFNYLKSLKKLSNSEYQERFRRVQLGEIIEEMKSGSDQLLLNNTALVAAANGIAITDRYGKILWVNPAFTKITGYYSEEVIGKTPNILKSGLEDVAFYQNLWTTILDGKVWAGNIINRRKDGTLYHEEQTITPVTNEKGEVTHFIGIKQDVSARVEAQEALERRNQELIQLNKAISTITSSLNLTEVEQNIVDTVKQLLPQVCGATLQLMDDHRNTITKTVSKDITKLMPDILFKPVVGATGIAIQQQSVVNIDDVENDPRFLRSGSTPPFKSLIVIPIVYKDRIFGVLSVEGKITHAFNIQDERLLKLLTNYAAAAIQNAQYSENLEEQVEKRTAELQSAQEKILAQERIEQEIRLAVDIQESLLPHQLPELPGFSIAAIAIPARSVSGDFYDFIINDQGVSFILADISGKGIPAAMLTSTARSLIRISSDNVQSCALALREVNSRLYDDLTHAEMFITMLMAQVDHSDGRIKYANAGHTEALWWHHHNQCCQSIPVTGIPLGIVKESDISEMVIAIRPDDIFLLYSDGITEATNPNDHLFGVERLKMLLQENSDDEPILLIQKIVDAVDKFCQGLPHSDDITMIILKAQPRHVQCVFPARLDQIDSISSFIRRNADAFGPAFAYQIDLATSEIITNIIIHGYSKYQGDMRGEISVFNDRLEIDFFDDGITFNPSDIPEIDLDQPHEGGYGLFIANQLLDQIVYIPATPRGNHWHLVRVYHEGEL